jgi:hypothetical protein
VGGAVAAFHRGATGGGLQGDARCRHRQSEAAIWLISRGVTRDETAGVAGVSSRWASGLIARYNAKAAGLTNGRRTNPGYAPLLDAALAAALARGLAAPPADGGLWMGWAEGGGADGDACG